MGQTIGKVTDVNKALSHLSLQQHCSHGSYCSGGIFAWETTGTMSIISPGYSQPPLKAGYKCKQFVYSIFDDNVG